MAERGRLGRAGRYLKQEVGFLRSSPGLVSPKRIWDEIPRLASAIEHLIGDIQTVAQEVARVESWAAKEFERFDQLAARQGQQLADLNAQRILATMTWIEAADVPTDTLVTVVTPTMNRAGMLRRAIASVQAQSYPNWEMIVVDDGGADDTEAMIASLDDSRVRYVRVSHGGTARARNTAVEQAQGDVLAYLDDDNRLHSGWLKAAVWALREHPDVDLVYGAQVRETDAHIPGLERTGLPGLWFHPFDRALLERTGFIDINCMAHRAGLVEQLFDESFKVAEDFERVLRLTRDKPALGIPVLASLYRMTGTDQMSWTHAQRRDEELAIILSTATTSPNN